MKVYYIHVDKETYGPLLTFQQAEGVKTLFEQERTGCCVYIQEIVSSA